MPPKIIVITGPTASGKTWLAVELARRYNGEVVSADSMQIYRRMDIGTAKPTRSEMRGVPHHMLDVADPEEDFSVARYVQLAVPCIKDILSRGRLPILAGGTGLYIDSLLSGRTFAAFSPENPLRRELEEQFAQEGGEAMLAELARVDPDSARKLHPNDAKRIIRALEVYRSTGRTIAQHNRETQALPNRYDPLYIGLAFRDREDMKRRIDQRVDQMMEDGLLDEVRALKERGCTRDMVSMQGLGYQELLAYLEGEYPLEEAVRLIKRDTRHFAKRQLTWFRRERDVRWLKLEDFDSDPDKVLKHILEEFRQEESKAYEKQ